MILCNLSRLTKDNSTGVQGHAPWKICENLHTKIKKIKKKKNKKNKNKKKKKIKKKNKNKKNNEKKNNDHFSGFKTIFRESLSYFWPLTLSASIMMRFVRTVSIMRA